MEQMAQILEIIMILAFGCSWPNNIITTYRNKSTKGKSLAFVCLILLGYVAGIASKLINPVYMASFSEKWYVLFFYVLNFCMVGLDFCLYFRNLKLDREAAKK